MRTPYASSGGVEPYYYSDYGTDIYRIAALQDKQDTNSITAEETAELLSLKLTVPTALQSAPNIFKIGSADAQKII